MRCRVTSEPSATKRYAVTWVLVQNVKNLKLLSTDPDGLVTFESTLEPNYRRRISATRLPGPTFQLSIRQAQTSDQGYYRCEVVESLQVSKGQWHPLPPVTQTIQLTLREPGTHGCRKLRDLTGKLFLYWHYKQISRAVGPHWTVCACLLVGHNWDTSQNKATSYIRMWWHQPELSRNQTENICFWSCLQNM